MDDGDYVLISERLSVNAGECSKELIHFGTCQGIVTARNLIFILAGPEEGISLNLLYDLSISPDKLS
jgi:hypothetical protein